MKVKITKQGAHGPKGEYEVGTEIEVDGDTLPAFLVNKAEIIGGKKNKGVKAAVTNPAGKTPDLPPSAAERQERMKALAEGLSDEDFTTSGAPDVSALNALLEDDEIKFTADERDQLWPGIAKG